jgi:hypothetical protein
MASFHRMVIGGPVNSGKSHLALTTPKGAMSLYHDRQGGDEDIIGMEKGGLYFWKGVQTDPRDQLMKKIKLMRDKEIEQLELKTVILDSVTYFQSWQRNKVAQNSLRGMNLQKHGDVVKDIRDVLFQLFELPVHVLLLTHITEEPIIDNKVIVGKVWKHDISDAIYKDISRECSLMGYTWKKTAKNPGERNTYGACFVEQVKNMTFKDAKAPNGWGPAEVADVRAWIHRLEDEAGKRREAALAAMLTEEDYKVPPSLGDAAAKPEEGSSTGEA